MIATTHPWRAGFIALRAIVLVLGSSLGVRGQGLPDDKTPALIQIGVEVVEVDEAKSQKLGIQWMDTLQISENDVPAVLKLGTFTRDKITATIQVLRQEGAADLLANPKLVTRDGTTATFHAGGELPYAVSSALGTVTIEYKQYGVNLKINPKIERNNHIAMSIQAEVSGIDEQNSVTLAGNTVPGIRSRQVSSELTLSPGYTLTLAGLIQNQKQWVVRGVPGLMHIPLLGYLFRHKSQTNLRTSIVVFITPTILDFGVPATAQGKPDELLENLEDIHHVASDRGPINAL